MAIPKPEPKDWQIANAQELQLTDKEVLAMLRDAKKRVDAILRDLPKDKQAIRRAQLEQSRARLLAEQAAIFERLGDIVSARRARSASRAARLSAAGQSALLSLVGKGAQGQFLYDSALQVSQRAIDTALARMRLSAVPLSQRIYNTSVWMGNRLGRLINETLASGLNAQEFARRARDWFNPNTPGGVRYAAMRLARTEINNAFHAMSAEKYASTPWITQADWNLSKSHPKPDICNTLAAESPFPSDKIPARPHPQCMCYITPRSIEEDEFIDNFLNGEYDDYLDAELEANGWNEPESPTQASKRPAKPEVTATQQNAVSGEAVHSIVPKGLFKRGSMTPHQRKALQTYESGWFMVLQGFLRDERWGDPDYKAEERHIGLIDEAMAGSVLPQPIQTWRGTFRSRSIFGDRLDHDLTGFSWKERGYGSTATNEEVVRNFLSGNTGDPDAPLVDDCVKMVVRVAAGVQALETSTQTKGSKANGPQAEITLQRDLIWKVVRDNGRDAEGVRHLEIEVDRERPSNDATGADGGAATGSGGSGAERTVQPESAGPVARRDDPEYQKDYNRGWRAGAGRNDLTRADKRGESAAFYDGFSDRSIGAPKWTRADERDEIDAQRRKL